MKSRLFTLACISILIFSACQNEPTSTNGFGASNKPLTGTPYSFPAGVTLNGTIVASQHTYYGSYYECPTDGTLPFSMFLTNSNAFPTTVIFPAGFVIPSADTLYQGAVLVQPDTISVPASTTLKVELYAECINETRTFQYNTSYLSPLISNNANLIPLIKLLATKKTVTNDPNEVIQQAVWDIANTGQMTQADITAINAFP